jgi:predicted Ser/Thr protein kinase
MTQPPPRVLKHYELERELGRGGMGAVYVGRDRRDGTRVAVKILHPWLAASDPSFRDRFEREAHTAALLRSPYTVQLIDYGVEGDTCFLVMEFVEGQSLGDMIEKRGPLDPLTALRYAAEVARALEEAGARGVVHRDIKPDNILITPDNRAKVTDFGIARSQAGSGMTATGMFVGTATYAAPEQAAGNADPRSDIYALGGTLFCALTGHPPFEGASAWEIIQQHQTEPVPMGELAHLPDAVCNPIRRCLEKDPRDRYQTAGELAGALERAIAALQQSTRRPGAVGAPQQPSAPARPRPPGTPTPPAAPDHEATIPWTPGGSGAGEVAPTVVAPTGDGTAAQDVPTAIARPVGEAPTIVSRPAGPATPAASGGFAITHVRSDPPGKDGVATVHFAIDNRTGAARQADVVATDGSGVLDLGTPGRITVPSGQSLVQVTARQRGKPRRPGALHYQVALRGTDGGRLAFVNASLAPMEQRRSLRGVLTIGVAAGAAVSGGVIAALALLGGGDGGAPSTPTATTAPGTASATTPVSPGAIPVRSIRTGAWDYRLTVRENSCAFGAKPNTPYDLTLRFDRVSGTQPYITDGERVRITAVAGGNETRIGEQTFSWDSFVVRYAVVGNQDRQGTAELTTTFADGTTIATATLRETYADGGGTCVIRASN